MVDVPTARLKAAVVAHHLRLLGAPATNVLGTPDRPVVVVSAAVAVEQLRSGDIELPRILVALDSGDADLGELGVRALGPSAGARHVRFGGMEESAWRQARSLHDVRVYECEGRHDAIAIASDGRPCWVRLQKNDCTVLVIGTDLGADLIRYRQGDPARTTHRTDAPMWGIGGERPLYLYEEQIPAGEEHERQADWWSMALAETVAKLLPHSLQPLAPEGAPGLLVVTGDDDQALLDKYDEQLARLQKLPVTYFLHPQTRHTPQTMRRIADTHRVEWGLHPDALDRPDQYADAYREQSAWFETLAGCRPDSVRNHGYLNDGYWGHLPVWLEHDVRVSANLPGINGRILNGSLLPARMAWQGELTRHWSILTAIGDGVRFALGMGRAESAQCILDLANRIVTSKLPGVIVVNLHPQNVSDVTEMHDVLHEVVGRLGFHPMALSLCINWFERRDLVLSGPHQQHA